MTVSTSTSSATYTGNAATVLFAVPFYFLVNTDLIVQQKVFATGAVKTLVLNSDYTLTGAGVNAGGAATLTVAPATGDTLLVSRNVALVQNTAYPSNSPFPAASHEGALDRLTMIAQQQATQLALGLFRQPLGAAFDLQGGSLINGATAINPTDVPNYQQVLGAVVAGTVPALGTSSGAGMVGFQQLGTGATLRTLQDRAQDTRSVFDFMSQVQINDVRNGTLLYDVSGAIRAAIAAATGTITFPAGNYRTDSPIIHTKSNIVLHGAGKGSTIITSTFAAGDVLCIGDGTANPGASGIVDLGMATSIPRTGGAAIRLRNGHGLFLRGIAIGYNQFDGIVLDGGAQQFIYKISDIEINSGRNGITFGLDGTQLQDVFIDSGIIANCVYAAILMYVCSGFYVKNIDTIVCNNGVLIAPGSGQTVALGWFDTILADTCGNNGWSVQPTNASGKITDIQFTQCWGSTCGTSSNGYGMLFDGTTGTVNGLHLVSPRLLNNKANGLYMLGSGLVNIYITDPMVECNSTSGAAAFDGIRVGAGVSRWSIIGGVCGLAGGFVANNQRFGISVDLGGSTQYAILGVNATGNQTGSILDQGTGQKTIVGCAGYLTKTTGEVALTTGTASVTVTHGLPTAPFMAKVTPVGDPQQRWWIGPPTATTFTINLPSNAASNAYFYWEASVAGA